MQADMIRAAAEHSATAPHGVLLMADRFPLSRLAADASDRPFFFGYALRQYATRQLWTNAQLATWLGCSADTLVQLRLCRTPADGTGCEQIAERFGVPVAKLREVIGL